MSGRKETVLDLAKFVDKVTGTLKGYDQLLNLVLDEAVEFLRVAIVPMLSSSFLYITHGNKMVSRDSR
ncbi:sm protein LSM7 [Trifolium repens]|nr:sm protein LSM7 [Trifolium repens]